MSQQRIEERMEKCADNDKTTCESFHAIHKKILDWMDTEVECMEDGERVKRTKIQVLIRRAIARALDMDDKRLFNQTLDAIDTLESCVAKSRAEVEDYYLE